MCIHRWNLPDHYPLYLLLICLGYLLVFAVERVVLEVRMCACVIICMEIACHSTQSKCL